jgi:hypothetical protein
MQNSLTVMPQSRITAKTVPFVMSRPAWDGTVVARPSGWRSRWWLPRTVVT